jgi:hypothetical protein
MQYEHEQPRAFFAEAQPCESCGLPTWEPRVWDEEHELWVAVDCGCLAPSAPTCPDLVGPIMEAETVGEVMEVCREHRKHCTRCGDPIEMPARVERQEREAA